MIEVRAKALILILAAGVILGSLMGRGPAKGAEDSVDLPSRSAFLGKAAIKRVALSPSGEQVAYLERRGKHDALLVMETEDLNKEHILVTQGVESISWSTDGSGLFLKTGDTLAFVDLKARTSQLIWRLEPKLSQRWAGVDPHRPRHFLIHQEEPDGRFTLLTLDGSGATSPIISHNQRLNHLVFGGDGQVRYLKYIEGKEQVIHSVPQGVEWLRCDYLDPCHLLGLGPEGEGFYLRARLEGDLWGLYLIEAPGAAPTLLHRDPEGVADLAQIEGLEPGEGPTLLRYDTPRPRTYGLDPINQAHIRTIEAALEGNNTSLDPRPSGPWLVTEFGPRMQHPRYHLYDPLTGHLRAILEEEREATLTLNPSILVDKIPLDYTAEDGMALHGYVSLPLDRDLAQAPVVIQVHGGPWNQSKHSYDSLTQFLVSRGYVVWDPNFRASTGYGQAYMEAGRGEFGQGKVLQDLFDGLEALGQRGWGDINTVAMIGHSFGGFATLSAAASQSSQIKVGIASAAPIDLLRAMDGLKEEALFTNGMPMGQVALDLVLPEDSPNARAEVQRQSPEALLAQTGPPLLILAGAQDEKINILEVQHHALALKALGKDVSLLVDPIAGHGFEDESLRLGWLYLAEALLSQHLGGLAEGDLSPELRTYLKRSLIIEGESLRGWDSQ